MDGDLKIIYSVLLYAYCPFSAVIGQIMVTWPPYKILSAILLSNVQTQSCQVHVLNSELELLKRNPTEVNWDKDFKSKNKSLKF